MKTKLARLPLSSGIQYLSSEGIKVDKFEPFRTTNKSGEPVTLAFATVKFENGANFLICTKSGFVIDGGDLQFLNPYRITHEVCIT